MSKICIVTTVHIANDTRVYFKEVRSLAKEHKITYIATNTELIKNEDIKIVEYKTLNNRVVRIFSFWKVWKLCKKQKCEVYHIQDPELILTGLMLKIFSRKKVIYDVHEDYPDYILQKEYLTKWVRHPLSKIMKFMEWLAGKTFDYVLTADRGVYKRFPSQKTEIIYNFPDLGVFKLQEIPPPKRYDIIYPGTLSKHMAHSILDIIQEVLKTIPDFKALIISASKATSSITLEWINEQMNLRGIRNNTVELMNRVPYSQVCLYIEQSKIGVIPLPNTPKFQKNIPTKLFEYMYCRIPVVANDLPPTRQFVEGKKCCELVDIDNVTQSARVIIELLKNEKLRTLMGKNGHQLVCDEYNWGKEEKKLLAIYKKVVGEVC